MSRLGVVVNPVAGVGGPAGLKGSDGAAVVAAAVARGAVPRAQVRAVRALTVLRRSGASVGPVLTVAGAMGEDAVMSAGLGAVVVHAPGDGPTTGADTRLGAAALVEAGADLVLFVGGDGTARDVADGVGGAAVLGIPAGVKMYSACFAVSPAAAGGIAADWFQRGRVLAVEQREVLDLDEELLRLGRAEPRVHGLVSVPVATGRTQARKSPQPASSGALVDAAARGVVAQLRPGVHYALGPGSTTARVAALLGLEGSALGIDVVVDGRLVARDVDERTLHGLATSTELRGVLTVIVGQGFLLGRGNQQLSARVVAAMPPDPFLVVATESKIVALGGRPLLVDTGDPRVDATLVGYVRIITGLRTTTIYRVSAPEVDQIEGGPTWTG